MTPQPRRKPRRVVLGKAYRSAIPPFIVVTTDVQVFRNSFVYPEDQALESGRLIWEPDPPKAKR